MTKKHVVKCTQSHEIPITFETINVNGQALAGSERAVMLDRKAGDSWRFKTKKDAMSFIEACGFENYIYAGVQL